MPTKVARKSTRKSTKRPAAHKRPSGTKRRSQSRTLSASHKRALAEGRNLSAAVERYMSLIGTPKRKGRKVSVATLTTRLSAAQRDLKSEKGVGRVLAAQQIRDLTTSLRSVQSTNGGTAHAIAEKEFIKVAKKFGENRGISYGAWRDAGVPAAVLKKAGIARTRG